MQNYVIFNIETMKFNVRGFGINCINYVAGGLLVEEMSEMALEQVINIYPPNDRIFRFKVVSLGWFSRLERLSKVLHHVFYP